MNQQHASSTHEFILVSNQQQGYACGEVDSYFDELAADFDALRQGHVGKTLHTSQDIRQVKFSAELGGYSIADVDHALDRVEDRFADFERRYFIERYGRAKWEQSVEESAAVIMRRLDRQAGERFRRPARKLTKGYFVKEVDALCESLRDHFRSAEELSPSLIRSAVFSSATGDMCYEETQVDAFLDSCIALILNLR